MTLAKFRTRTFIQHIAIFLSWQKNPNSGKAVCKYLRRNHLCQKRIFEQIDYHTFCRACFYQNCFFSIFNVLIVMLHFWNKLNTIWHIVYIIWSICLIYYMYANCPILTISVKLHGRTRSISSLVISWIKPYLQPHSSLKTHVQSMQHELYNATAENEILHYLSFSITSGAMRILFWNYVRCSSCKILLSFISYRFYMI